MANPTFHTYRNGESVIKFKTEHRIDLIGLATLLALAHAPHDENSLNKATRASVLKTMRYKTEESGNLYWTDGEEIDAEHLARWRQRVLELFPEFAPKRRPG